MCSPRLKVLVVMSRLFLAGDGSLLEKLYEQAQKLGARNDVIFCGNKDQSWLISFIPLAVVVSSIRAGCS